MNRLIHPVGPESAAVYWRRRAAVLAGIVIVVVVLVMIIKALASPGTGGQKASPSPQAPSPSVTSTKTDPQAAACTAEQLTGGKLAQGADLLVTSDKPSYTEAEPVTLTVQVKNTGAKDCRLLNNPHTVVLNVVSGSDRIFDSSDCAANTPEDAGDPITIKAGEIAAVPVSWDGSRSQQGCREIAEKPFRSADATYSATVKIMGVDSDETRFLLVP
ncbi:MAG: hypothetical protein LBD77_02890 [Bifidobacteriaceae bacterium]|nr:hypothetical protein [Bifidobacteriaceae bacterium]